MLDRTMNRVKCFLRSTVGASQGVLSPDGMFMDGVQPSVNTKVQEATIGHLNERMRSARIAEHSYDLSESKFISSHPLNKQAENTEGRDHRHRRHDHRPSEEPSHKLQRRHGCVGLSEEKIKCADQFNRLRSNTADSRFDRHHPPKATSQKLHHVCVDVNEDQITISLTPKGSLRTEKTAGSEVHRHQVTGPAQRQRRRNGCIYAGEAK